ncbi:Thioredoxin-like [Sphingobacterium nematocida]|uniref:Thioredoxin-like n=1 Tax=Sphingobacterium nematocida TaxID=1513896 RepID=A0A1T5AYU6_9SPHI|nr:thioredoxin family protein [Sphingobacterium nematocida]SKB39999.1 Thioredoxin-like [Sphingobacterium nematocida]
MKKVKNIILAIATLFIGSTVSGQGIQFEHNYKDALARAKKEKKAIFVDFYTSWCGPCKQMDADVFSKKNAGDYFNSNFVNLKIQCDDKGEGVELGKQYKIAAYPTLMVMDADGNAMHSMAGGTSIQGLIEFSKVAMDPNRNQLTLIKKFEAGERDHSFLTKYFEMLVKSYQSEKATADFDKYFTSLSKSQKLTKNTYDLMEVVKPAPFSAPFDFLEQNKKEFYKIVGKEQVDKTIANKYLWYLKALQDDGLSTKDMTNFNDKMKIFKSKNYPYYDEYAAFCDIFNSKTADNSDYDVPLYKKKGTAFLDKYGKNNAQYTLALTSLLGNFTGKKDQNVEGIKWMEDLLAWDNKPSYYNTYLYITWRNYQFDKALEIAEKMKANAIANNSSTADAEKNIQMVKDLKAKYGNK